jgi:hypothetical protein
VHFGKSAICDTLVVPIRTERWFRGRVGAEQIARGVNGDNEIKRRVHSQAPAAVMSISSVLTRTENSARSPQSDHMYDCSNLATCGHEGLSCLMLITAGAANLRHDASLYQGPRKIKCGLKFSALPHNLPPRSYKHDMESELTFRRSSNVLLA